MLYQQGTQRIEVIVRKETGGGVSGGAGTKETDADKTTGTGGEESESLGTGAGMNNSRTKRIVRANFQHLWTVTKQIADLSVDYWASGIGMQSGDQALQDRTERKIEQIKDVTSVAYSVGMGAMSGVWAGPIGIILGAAMSAATSGATLISKYSGRQREYDYKIFKEESSIEYQRARAGTDWTNGRLR